MDSHGDLADAPEMCLDRRREDPVWKASQAEDVQSRRDGIPMSVAPEVPTRTKYDPARNCGRQLRQCGLSRVVKQPRRATASLIVRHMAPR